MVQPLPVRLQETPSQTAGPYVHIGLIPHQAGFDIFETNFSNVLAGPETKGERIRIEGRVEARGTTAGRRGGTVEAVADRQRVPAFVVFTDATLIATLKRKESEPATFRAALAELGVTARSSLAFAGSSASFKSANAAGVATISVGAVDSEGAGILHRIADCRQIHDSWRDTHPTPTTA